jgi:hypothetical protein
MRAIVLPFSCYSSERGSRFGRTELNLCFAVWRRHGRDVGALRRPPFISAVCRRRSTWGCVAQHEATRRIDRLYQREGFDPELPAGKRAVPPRRVSPPRRDDALQRLVGQQTRIECGDRARMPVLVMRLSPAGPPLPTPPCGDASIIV